MLGRQEWKHLRVLHARTRGEPLHIAFAIAATGATRIKMVGIALFYYGHGFKTCVRMGRETWHGVAVVHAKWRLRFKILSPIHRAIDGNRCHVGIARRIGIKMVARKQKRVFQIQTKLHQLFIQNKRSSHNQSPIGGSSAATLH